MVKFYVKSERKMVGEIEAQVQTFNTRHASSGQRITKDMINP